MKILQLCHRIPYPAVDGGTIAMFNLAQSLAEQGNSVKIVALNTLKHFINPETLPDFFKSQFQPEVITIDTSVKMADAFLNLFSRKSYNISRFYNNQFEDLLIHLFRTEKFDVVQIESLFMTPYLDCIRKHSSAKVVLRAHNVEHVIWKRLADSEKNYFKKKYIKLLAHRLEKYESSYINKVDAILAITNEDATIFRNSGCTIPILVTPVGIDLKNYSLNENEQQEWCLFHLGSMDWLPNLEAINWFLENCWQPIHQQFPELKLYLAGRGFPKHLMDQHYPNVLCEGEIADSNKYMSGKQIMIVPLLSGSGMRVKIIQGMALGKTILSTTIGAEGIHVTNGENILIADTPQQFLEAVKKCLNNKSFALQLGKAARILTENNYSNDVVGKQVSEFYRQLAGI